MSLRHAAALALVSWYLLVPPFDAGQPDGVDTDATFVDWDQLGVYDSSVECEDVATRVLDRAKAQDNKLQIARILFGRCVESDDQRLKEN